MKFSGLVTLGGMCLMLTLCNGQDCDSKETCEQCIQDIHCFWCTSPVNKTITGATARQMHCLPIAELSSCHDEETENPVKNFFNFKSEPLSESQQISPQRVRLRLRKNEPFNITFQYKQSDNYPVDLYYIMDLSNSMASSKKEIAGLGGKLAEEMKKKTNNFRIGFGSFVDKLTLPFVNTRSEKLLKPCEGCAPPYSFINHLSLISNSKLFTEKVHQTKMSGNLDSPEGGLDAIMQAMVCKDKIGWRPNARHLLVMSTDAVSHIAGDGKLGGIIEPNDAQCHLDDNNYYTHGLIYDYPSVSQINYIARQNNINLIFAIVINETKKNSDGNRELKKHYQAMSQAIDNSKTGTLSSNSNNVVKFISDIYDEIRDSVRMTSNASKKEVGVTITSTCPGFVDGSCTSVKLGQTVNFTATIEPLSCSTNAKSKSIPIIIKPEGLQDSLLVDLEVLCDCNCTAQAQPSHKQCNNQGDLVCGICRCNTGKNGERCQCDGSAKSQEVDIESKVECFKPGSTKECSNHGTCKCGKCQCNVRENTWEVFSGKYCECDNFSCYLNCSKRSACVCGKCVRCDDGWTGSGCECSTKTSDCMEPGSNVKCSGHGDCICGVCHCVPDGDTRYAGKYCEDCATCRPKRCEELKPCVECQAYHQDSDCAVNCTQFNTTIVDKLDEAKEDEMSPIKSCKGDIEKECSFKFEYSYDDDNNLIVRAEKEKICRKPPSIYPIVGGVIGSVLAIGIITLIAWKIATTVHDKREYARFLNERNQTQWAVRGDNPLYKPGTSQYSNPAYNRNRASARASNRVSVASVAKQVKLEAKE